MASSDSKYCIEKMGMMVSLPRDNKLKMAIFITQVELSKVNMLSDETLCPIDVGSLPNGQFLR